VKNTPSITDVDGICVGHAHDLEARTGCTVILPEEGAVAGVDVRGSAPGTREIDLLRPVRLVQRVNAVLLTGGSAFGLDAAGGVQQFLEERDIGYDVGVTKVPIVPTAVIFDLSVGDPKVRPDKIMGYQACANASDQETSQGLIGVGAGATAGKLLGQKSAMNGGVGISSARLGKTTVGVLVVLNSLGNVIDPASGKTLAGARDPKTGALVDPVRLLSSFDRSSFAQATNTTLTVVATDASLTREHATKVAQMAQDGIARAIYPAHTMYDGDVVFALSVGDKHADLNALGTVAADLVAQAIVRAVKVGNSQR
jgi:L-aminopeptidase/D-esterase-like protein